MWKKGMAAASAAPPSTSAESPTMQMSDGVVLAFSMRLCRMEGDGLRAPASAEVRMKSKCEAMLNSWSSGCRRESKFDTMARPIPFEFRSVRTDSVSGKRLQEEPAA